MAKKRTSKKSGPVSFSGEERIVVVYGDELFLVNQAMKKLREKLVGIHGEGLDVIHFEGKSAELADVLDEVRSVGLMQQYKLVIVDDADDFVKKYREKLERYVDDVVDIATLALRPKSWNKSWRLSKATVKVGQVIQCEPLSEIEAERWLSGHARDVHEVKLSMGAVGMLVDRLGVDLMRLDSEVAKLGVSVGDGVEVTEKEVEALVGRASNDDAWAIQEALLSGDPVKAVSTLHELLLLSRQPVQLITYFVSDLVRKVHHGANMLKQGKRDFDVCKAMRVWGERQRPFMQAVKRLGAGKSGILLDRLVEMDRKSKSGFGKGDQLLERFCIQFCLSLR